MKLEIDLNQPSTWRGLAWIGGFMIAMVWPEQAGQALTVAAGIAGAVGTVFKDA